MQYKMTRLYKDLETQITRLARKDDRVSAKHDIVCIPDRKTILHNGIVQLHKSASCLDTLKTQQNCFITWACKPWMRIGIYLDKAATLERPTIQPHITYPIYLRDPTITSPLQPLPAMQRPA
jgi:hypothetical protein